VGVAAGDVDEQVAHGEERRRCQMADESIQRGRDVG